MMSIFIKYVFLVLLCTPWSVYSQSLKKGGSNGTKSATTPMQQPDLNAYFKPLKWRSIGPFRGGRSVATSGVRNDINTYYMGTTGGGLWKTEDLGLNWKNISDGYFKTGSVGAIAVAESDPNIVYVGMGEHAVRGVMTHHGDGVYKSTDAGKTWKHMGLTKTQHISRIVIHPKNPDIVYIAAQGALYENTQDRGIYKSMDGGLNWQKILYIDTKTGCAEISMDMNNPLILYAAMWEHGRLPWKVISGGPGSGLYKSIDGGSTWEKIHQGLPNELGKMAITVCRSNSEKLYALIESDSEKGLGGLFVSENAGKSWSRVSSDNKLIQRAWYYIEVYADPKNENTVYVLSAPALRSIDGGKTWNFIQGPHGDYHDLWINPDNPKNMIIADDGGASVSVNYGKTWSTQANMPTAQLYRINVDNHFPYRIYAGQQDNTSLVISSMELGSGNITAGSWTKSAGGESAFLAFDPDDPRYVLGGSYQGTIEVLDTKSQASTNIMAAPIQYLGRETKDMKYRFNWNAPIIWSKFEKNTYYHGAQYLLKTSDMGKTWEEVSPDLTKNEKSKQGKGGGPFTNEAVGAENYGTICYIAESLLEKGTIFVASDDGLLHMTRDDCENWVNITPPTLKECLINAIEVSPHHPGTLYIATTRYKFNDHTPGIYKSSDYGKTWSSINKGIADNAFTRVVREDDVVKDLLYAGTELGTYISWDGGANWASFQLNLPITPITDLKVHRGNLIAATSGRSFWILDDLSLIRQSKKDTSSFDLFQPSPAMLNNFYSEFDNNDPDFDGTHLTLGVNPASGAVFYYFLANTESESPLTMEIMDASGHVIRKFTSLNDSLYQKYDGAPPQDPSLSKNKGLNRFVWDLRHHTIPGVPNVYIESSFRGHKAIPGDYIIQMKYGDWTKRVSLKILPNPLYSIDQNTYIAYDRLMSEMEKDVTDMHNLINSLDRKKQQVENLISTLDDTEKFKNIKISAHNLISKMKSWDESMVQRKSKAYDDVENFENKFTANYMFMMNHNESDLPRINQPTLDRKQELDKEWVVLKSIASDILENGIPSLNRDLWHLGIGGIWK